MVLRLRQALDFDFTELTTILSSVCDLLFVKSKYVKCPDTMVIGGEVRVY